MSFFSDDLYKFKLSIRISDYGNASFYFKKVQNKIDNETYDYLSKYCTDTNIYNLIEKNCRSIKNLYNKNFLLNLIKNPYDNVDIIIQNFEKGNYKVEDFIDDDSNRSPIIFLFKNTNNLKKLRISEYLLNKSFNFNSKNSNGQSISQILIDENPTDINAIFIEKIEKLLKTKSEENNFLFEDDSTVNNNKKVNSKTIEKEIKNYISEPDQSYKIQFADIEYHLLKLTMKLRRIYQVNTVNLSYIDNYKEMSQIHTASIEEFIFEKLLIDKI